MEREQAVRLTQNLLRKMVEREGSDLFITAAFPPAIKVDGTIHKATDTPLSADQAAIMVRSIMNDKQIKEFDATKEANFAIAPQGIGRFRVSAFIQQGMVGAVLRTITTEIPTLEDLELPPILKDVVMNKHGLCIVVGGTGSGKSTTLAAMIGHRNENSRGHIVSVEDPIEYVHPHKGCVITQREVGVDTESWHAALKNTLRQAPDVILIGEIRDKETMEYGIQFAETGHLCLATLHANSANQALDRIINFFPDERRQQLLMDLSLNAKAFISQRLVPREGGIGRVASMEILLNTPLIQDLMRSGRSKRSWPSQHDSVCRPLINRCSLSMKKAQSPTKNPCVMQTPRMSCAYVLSWRVSATLRLPISSQRACASWKRIQLRLSEPTGTIDQ